MFNEYSIITLFLITNFFIILFFDKIKIFHVNIDNPDNKRKLHLSPIPLAGGTIIFLNLFLYYIIVLYNQDVLINETIFSKESFNLFFFTSSIIFVLGFLDDRYNFPASLKFLIIAFIILIILFLDDDLKIKTVNFSFLDKQINLSSYSIILTTFCFLVFLNAFNMFDGINLQSSLYSTIIFLSILISYYDSLMIKILLISIFGYLYLNFKNKSFLGDSGTLLIAFIIGYIFVKLYNFDKIIFTDEVVIYMLVPGIDLIRLFFKRISLRRNPLTPDRFHIHHLLLSKYSYLKSILILVGLIILPISMNFLGINRLFIMIFFFIIYAFLVKIILSKN
tara:strand:- start:927 stop:1934 length:1008 start_codon:yes stop_codon:yes gene_type:complete